MHTFNDKQFPIIRIVFTALFSLLFIHPLPTAAAELYYYDEAGILTPETKELILTINKQYNQTIEKPQIIVAVIESLDG